MEEIGSLVVILRLWRVIKVSSRFRWSAKDVLTLSLQIIEELSAGAEESMEPLHEHLEVLKHENGELKREIEELKKQQASNST